jgi:hypothetical protein
MIVHSKWSQHISNPTHCFLLLMTIKCEKSMTLKSQTLLYFDVFLCFINKELVWKHWWRRQTKVLVITIGSHFSKVVFNVTNLIIIWLSWFTFYNPQVDWHTKGFHFKPLKDETLECKALPINIFGVNHDYHMDVFKRWYKG